MAAYRISQVVERTGFSAPTLRYYEDIGLVRPARRTDAGYRVYDDGAVDRLRFVAHAKRLGLTLDEIADLVNLWDAEECGPVQERLRTLLLAKQVDLQRQIDDLTAFRHELDAVASRLGVDATAGACGPSCGCVDETATSVDVALGLRSDATPRHDSPPVACTLDAEAMPERLDAWARIATKVAERQETATGIRVRLERGVNAAKLAELVAAEQQCCAFFTFRMAWIDGDTVLEIDAPAEACSLFSSLLPPA